MGKRFLFGFLVAALVGIAAEARTDGAKPIKVINTLSDDDQGSVAAHNNTTTLPASTSTRKVKYIDTLSDLANQTNSTEGNSTSATAQNVTQPAAPEENTPEVEYKVFKSKLPSEAGTK